MSKAVHIPEALAFLFTFVGDVCGDCGYGITFILLPPNTGEAHPLSLK
jgi:hypothetical protein